MSDDGPQLPIEVLVALLTEMLRKHDDRDLTDLIEDDDVRGGVSNFIGKVVDGELEKLTELAQLGDITRKLYRFLQGPGSGHNLVSHKLNDLWVDAIHAMLPEAVFAKVARQSTELIVQTHLEWKDFQGLKRTFSDRLAKVVVQSWYLMPEGTPLFARGNIELVIEKKMRMWDYAQEHYLWLMCQVHDAEIEELACDGSKLRRCFDALTYANWAKLVDSVFPERARALDGVLTPYHWRYGTLDRDLIRLTVRRWFEERSSTNVVSFPR